MLTPGQLVREIADVTGMPEASVVVIDRNLAVAGLRTMYGRGPSAAKTTPRDAAHLLITAMAVGELIDAVAALEAFGKTIGPRETVRPREARHIPELAELPRPHSFVDAVEALITAGKSGTLPADGRSLHKMVVQTSLPGVFGDIIIPGRVLSYASPGAGDPDNNPDW